MGAEKNTPLICAVTRDYASACYLLLKYGFGSEVVKRTQSGKINTRATRDGHTVEELAELMSPADVHELFSKKPVPVLFNHYAGTAADEGTYTWAEVVWQGGNEFELLDHSRSSAPLTVTNSASARNAAILGLMGHG